MATEVGEEGHEPSQALGKVTALAKQWMGNWWVEVAPKQSSLVVLVVFNGLWCFESWFLAGQN